MWLSTNNAIVSIVLCGPCSNLPFWKEGPLFCTTLGDDPIGETAFSPASSGVDFWGDLPYENVYGKVSTQMKSEICYMGVSKNNGTPKSSILIGFSKK